MQALVENAAQKPRLMTISSQRSRAFIILNDPSRLKASSQSPAAGKIGKRYLSCSLENSQNKYIMPATAGKYLCLDREIKFPKSPDQQRQPDEKRDTDDTVKILGLSGWAATDKFHGAAA